MFSRAYVSFGYVCYLSFRYTGTDNCRLTNIFINLLDPEKSFWSWSSWWKTKSLITLNGLLSHCPRRTLEYFAGRLSTVDRFSCVMRIKDLEHIWLSFNALRWFALSNQQHFLGFWGKCYSGNYMRVYDMPSIWVHWYGKLSRSFSWQDRVTCKWASQKSKSRCNRFYEACSAVQQLYYTAYYIIVLLIMPRRSNGPLSWLSNIDSVSALCCSHWKSILYAIWWQYCRYY